MPCQEVLKYWTAKGFPPICPDAVFGVRSPSNTQPELREKMHAYPANGARIGVLVDPEEQAVQVYWPGREAERFESPATVELDPELLGFMLDLARIFGE